MKTFCKRHEVFYDAGGPCADCAAMPVKPEPVLDFGPGITVYEPAKVDAAKVFENMKVPYSGPEKVPVEAVTFRHPSYQAKVVVMEPKLAHAGNCPFLSGHRCGCGAAPNKPPYASPTSGCMCGETYIGDLSGPLDHSRTFDGVHHRGDRCWIPAPFPFPPLPPPGSDEALEEMRRSVPSVVAPNNALVRYVREAQGRREVLIWEFQETLKGMFPPGEEQIENATYVGIDRVGLRYPQWKSAGESTMSIEQAMKEASALLEGEGWKPDLVVEVNPSGLLLQGMAREEPLHDPATCKICRTINERSAPQQQPIAHDWDLNQDVCLRCGKTGMEMAATPAFKSCVETPPSTYKPLVRARTGYGSIADPRGVAQLQAQLGFKRRQLAELQRQIDELASKIANAARED